MAVIPRVSGNLATRLLRIGKEEKRSKTRKIPLRTAYAILRACSIITGLGPITPNSTWALERKIDGN